MNADLNASQTVGGGPSRIVGIAGWSGAGKTTLVTRIIPVLNAMGLSVSTLKHAHHGFDVDRPGKDSYAHREAGAHEVLIASARRWALLHELRDEAEWSLPQLLAQLSPVDLILVEGFKREPYPKIEVHRHHNGKPLLFPDDPDISAIATDDDAIPTTLPCFLLDDIDGIAAHAVAIAERTDSVIARLGGAGRVGGDIKFGGKESRMKVLDLVGLKCPLPALRTRKELKRMSPGERIEIRASDPLAGIDVPNAVREAGDILEQLRREADIHVFTVLRASR